MARAIWTAFPRSAWFSLDSSMRYMMAGSTTSSNWPNIQRLPSGFLADPIHTLPLSFRTNSCLCSSSSKNTVSSVKKGERERTRENIEWKQKLNLLFLLNIETPNFFYCSFTHSIFPFVSHTFRHWFLLSLRISLSFLSNQNAVLLSHNFSTYYSDRSESRGFDSRWSLWEFCLA